MTSLEDKSLNRSPAKQSLCREQYDRLVKEKEIYSNKEIYLNYAIYLAESGKTREVLDVLTHIYTNFTCVSSEHIYKILCNLVETLRKEERERIQPFSKLRSFTCPLCLNILNEPVTQGCGHTYCKRCLEKDKPKTCKVCQHRLKSLRCGSHKVNVLISDLVSKWWPNEKKAVSLRNQGNKKFFEQQLEEAVRIYSEAIENGEYFFIIRHFFALKNQYNL